MDPPVDGKRQRHGGGRQKAAPKSERVRWSLREVEAKGERGGGLGRKRERGGGGGRG